MTRKRYYVPLTEYLDVDTAAVVTRARGVKDKELIVALSLGAVLLNAEILTLTRGDVTVDDIGVVIRAGKTARSVPVRTEYDFPLRTGGTGRVWLPDKSARYRSFTLREQALTLVDNPGKQVFRTLHRE